MFDQPQQEVRPRSRRIEGYLALVFTGLCFAGPLYELLPQPLSGSAWLMAYAAALLFAISGIRHGELGASIAACIAMLILSACTLTYLIVALH
jgi:hypothetical protein